jgi:hypothetical protein
MKTSTISDATPHEVSWQVELAVKMTLSIIFSMRYCNLWKYVKCISKR